MWNLGFQELIVLGVLAVVLFGKRLPEVARSLGASYRDFRRGLQDIQAQFNVNETVYRAGAGKSSLPNYSRRAEEIDDYDQPTAPKFEMPTTPTEGNEA